MSKKAIRALAVAAALGFAPPAMSAEADALKELREQLRQLKEQYEALERRLERAEKAAAPAAASPQPPQAVAAPAGRGENAFNPAVSLILNGTYANLSRDPTAYPRAANGFRINGFAPTMGEVAPPARGLGLAESELVLSANVDPTFRGTATIALAPDDTVGVEEAFIQPLALPRGFTLKAGRFLSSVGYLNEFHTHAWDFADAPLANKVFLGGRLAEDGIQARWIAPTDTYFDIGFDLGRGRSFPAGPAGGRNKNGVGSANLFAHVGDDLSRSTSWQIGLSHLRTSPEGRAYEDFDSTATVVSNSFTGRSRLSALSGVLKWAPNGNAFYNSFKLQGEYFRRTEEGTLTYDTGAASLGRRAGGLTTRQSGWYAQSVYQFIPRWRVGYRYDRLDAGSTRIGLVDAGTLAAADFPILAGYNPTRSTLMTDWSASEFSRLRVQLARDRSRMGAPDNQLFIQYVMSLGAHGAHKF